MYIISCTYSKKVIFFVRMSNLVQIQGTDPVLKHLHKQLHEQYHIQQINHWQVMFSKLNPLLHERISYPIYKWIVLFNIIILFSENIRMMGLFKKIFLFFYHQKFKHQITEIARHCNPCQKCKLPDPNYWIFTLHSTKWF